MKDWWLSLQAREQLIISVSAVALLVALLYLLAWEPVANKRAQLRNSVAAQQETLTWMRQASTQIKQARTQGPGNRVSDRNRSLISVVDSSTKRAKLRKPIQRMDPEGQDGVKLWVEDADFDALIRWLGDLQRQYGAIVSRATFSKQETGGRVNSRLSLQRP